MKFGKKFPQTYPNGWLPIFKSNDINKDEEIDILIFNQNFMLKRDSTNKLYLYKTRGVKDNTRSRVEAITECYGTIYFWHHLEVKNPINGIEKFEVKEGYLLSTRVESIFNVKVGKYILLFYNVDP